MTVAPRLLLGGFLGAVLVACGPAAPTASPVPAATDTATASPAATISPTPTPATTVAPTPTPVAGIGICDVANLKASHGLIDGAAGSLFTDVVLVSDTDCTVDTSPSLGLQDKSGNALVTATPAGAGTIQLTAGDAYTSTVRIANWCGPDPAFPLALVLWIDADKLVVGGGSFPDGGMPGCIGTGGVRLESNPWAVSP